MERNVRPKSTYETRRPKHTSLDWVIPDDRILCLDAADAETAIRSVENGTTFCNAGAVRGRSS